MSIPFNKPAMLGKEKDYVMDVINNRKLSGDGNYTKKCSKFMEENFKAKKVILTTSCTHALEMASILLNLKEGDEVIMPSYTFTSTATSVCIRNATPVFVDIREDTLNIDEDKIEKRITQKTKAIYVVHYAGIGCDMNKIMNIANKHKLFVVEDAAQGVDAKFNGKYLGTHGHLGAYSFHETKNYVCGEGGALIINDERFIERAEIIREKGTNRNKYLKGEIDKYTWVDIGSSYLPSEILAAYLYAQLEKKEDILKKREYIFKYYYNNLKNFETEGILKIPYIPENCESNYHMFYLILCNEEKKNELIKFLKQNGILAVTHYIPLHLSPMGEKFGYKKGDFPITEKIGENLIRLPFYYDLEKEEMDYVINKIKEWNNKYN